MTDGLSEAYDMKKWDVFCENNDLLLENDQLAAENAKLRELLQRTWDAFHDATAREFVGVKNELRELGIEVDA